MADGEDDMGSTTTAKTELDFSPAQLAAQATGLGEAEATDALQTMQILRSLAFLQPDSATNTSVVTEPIRTATGVYQNPFATNLRDMGLPPSVSMPVAQRLESIAPEISNEARRQVVERYLRAPSLPLFKPSYAPALTTPLSQRQVSKTSQGSGAQAMQAIGLAVGIGAGALIL